MHFLVVLVHFDVVEPDDDWVDAQQQEAPQEEGVERGYGVGYNFHVDLHDYQCDIAYDGVNVGQGWPCLLQLIELGYHDVIWFPAIIIINFIILI